MFERAGDTSPYPKGRPIPPQSAGTLLLALAAWIGAGAYALEAMWGILDRTAPSIIAQFIGLAIAFAAAALCAHWVIRRRTVKFRAGLSAYEANIRSVDVASPSPD